MHSPKKNKVSLDSLYQLRERKKIICEILSTFIHFIQLGSHSIGWPNVEICVVNVVHFFRRLFYTRCSWRRHCDCVRLNFLLLLSIHEISHFSFDLFLIFCIIFSFVFFPLFLRRQIQWTHFVVKPYILRMYKCEHNCCCGCCWWCYARYVILTWRKSPMISCAEFDR